MDNKTISKLKNEIKKLKNCKTSSLITYKLIHQNNKENKLYNSLILQNENDDIIKPFLILKPNNKYCINYSITLNMLKDIDFECIFLLGVKDLNKFKIIKGSKIIGNKINVINNQLLLNNTILYETDTKQEIYIISCFDDNIIEFNLHKSILKYSII